MDRPALERLHRVERDRVAGDLDLASRAVGDLANRVFASLPVALDVDDDTPVLEQPAAQDHVHNGLQSAQIFASPTDQGPQVATTHIQDDRIAPLTDADLALDTHQVEQIGNRGPAFFGRLVRGRRRRRLGVHHRNLHDCLFRRFLDNPHVYVATAFAELDQRGVNGFIEGAPSTLSRLQLPGGLQPPLTRYCWIIATQLEMNQ